MKRKIDYIDIIIMLVIAIITFLSLAPMVITVMMSMSDSTSAALGRVLFWPRNFTLAPYQQLMRDARFFTAFGVSVRRVLLGVSINTVFAIVMAYPLSKSKSLFPHRNVYIWFLIVNLLFSGGMIPSFMLLRSLHLLDTMWALVLPGAVSIFNIIILMNFYKGIPSSLEESAFVDGASPFTILWKIYVPLARACIATITLFAVVGHWNAFFDGRIYITSPERLPLQTYIQSLSVALDANVIRHLSSEEIIRRMEISNLTFNAAQAVVSMIPIIAIYPFLQRYFVTGMVLGAVKE